MGKYLTDESDAYKMIYLEQNGTNHGVSIMHLNLIPYYGSDEHMTRLISHEYTTIHVLAPPMHLVSGPYLRYYLSFWGIQNDTMVQK